MDSGSYSLQNTFSTFEVNTSSPKCNFLTANTSHFYEAVHLLYGTGIVWVVTLTMFIFPVFNIVISQGYTAGNSQRSPFSLAAQLLLCQQPLLIPGLLLHCAVVYYFVLAETSAHPSACGPALHPFLCPIVGSRPPLTHTPNQPLNFCTAASTNDLYIVSYPLWLICLVGRLLCWEQSHMRIKMRMSFRTNMLWISC